MRGLRTQESDDFVRFFKIIQREAAKEGKVFFADSGDGHIGHFGNIECEDMFGWLIPKEKASEFEKMYVSGTIPDTWDDFTGFADWHADEKGKIAISFDFFG